MPRTQRGSQHIITITHKCGHEGLASTNAINPNASVDVLRQQGRDCYQCRQVVKCQMTMVSDEATLGDREFKCGKPAKFRNPQPKMGIAFVCGIHARSLDKMYERIGENVRCQEIARPVTD